MGLLLRYLDAIANDPNRTKIIVVRTELKCSGTQQLKWHVNRSLQWPNKTHCVGGCRCGNRVPYRVAQIKSDERSWWELFHVLSMMPCRWNVPQHVRTCCCSIRGICWACSEFKSAFYRTILPEYPIIFLAYPYRADVVVSLFLASLSNLLVINELKRLFTFLCRSFFFARAKNSDDRMSHASGRWDDIVLNNVKERLDIKPG